MSVRLETMRSLFRRLSRRGAALLLAGLALSAAVAVSACCDLSFKLGRVRGFLAGVFEVSVEVAVEGYVSVDFSGDLSAWSQISSFADVEVETDISASDFSIADIKYDVDYDASDEKIRVLRAEGTGTPLVFLAWKGDKYTVDKGVCYLGWYEQGQAKLAAAYCKQTNGAMYCHMPPANEDAAYCEKCNGSGSCTTCDMTQSLEKCLPKEETGVDLDVDIDIDIDIDIDLDVDVEPPVGGS